ncbi:MAG: type 1 glutamine amidotransferase [Gammaproteobacteria bacterium]|nr:type 1 glutamine amidotransferase [Gammaproteobacteria bacterium]
MKKPILIFRHFSTEGAGYLGHFLDRHNLPHRTVRIDAGDAIPESITDIPGLVFMGGPMSVNDRLPWIPPLLHLIRSAVAADLPVLGHCLGGQLMSKALGGTVRRNHSKEFGWLPVSTVGTDLAEKWFTGLPSRFEVFHWHGETFSIPPGATHILKSLHCRHQAFALGKCIGLQCHIEMTAEMVRRWAHDGASEIDAAGPVMSVQRPAQMQLRLEHRVAALHRVADAVYTQWIKGLRH